MQRCSTVFIPSAAKFHYVFNMRDLSNVFVSVLFCTNEAIRTPRDLMRLWAHETQRVYRDKLACAKDVESFDKAQVDIVRKYFEDIDDGQIVSPLVFCHFAKGCGENKYSQVSRWKDLGENVIFRIDLNIKHIINISDEILSSALRNYNEMNAAMDLVLFEDAMMHICRINRILESPQANVLLIGVGGSGKQSLSRLAAFISSLEVFQMTLRKGYSIQDLRQDFSNLYQKTGVKNLGCVFLMSDAQVANEKFLVLLNTFLATGEVPDLFTEDQIEEIINAMKSEVKVAGLQDTRESCWRFFIERVKKQLKVVLCFSPVGNVLRIRARKFPAILNCTCIDWFHSWPHQALISVSNNFLADNEDIPPAYLDSVSELMAFVHNETSAASRAYKTSDKKFNYTTPKSFLELINLYTKLLADKNVEMRNQIERLESGLEKLRETKQLVDELKAQLAIQEKELDIKNAEADALILKVGVETKNVSQEKTAADEEKCKVDKITKDVSIKQVDCERDLQKAEPALIAAQEALNTLNKANLTELKSFGSPPTAVLTTTEAVMILVCGKKGKIPKDRSWLKVKQMMSKVDQFLDGKLSCATFI